MNIQQVEAMEIINFKVGKDGQLYFEIKWKTSWLSLAQAMIACSKEVLDKFQMDVHLGKYQNHQQLSFPAGADYSSFINKRFPTPSPLALSSPGPAMNDSIVKSSNQLPALTQSLSTSCHKRKRSQCSSNSAAIKPKVLFSDNSPFTNVLSTVSDNTVDPRSVNIYSPGKAVINKMNLSPRSLPPQQYKHHHDGGLNKLQKQPVQIVKSSVSNVSPRPSTRHSPSRLTKPSEASLLKPNGIRIPATLSANDQLFQRDDHKNQSKRLLVHKTVSSPQMQMMYNDLPPPTGLFNSPYGKFMVLPQLLSPKSIPTIPLTQSSLSPKQMQSSTYLSTSNCGNKGTLRTTQKLSTSSPSIIPNMNQSNIKNTKIFGMVNMESSTSPMCFATIQPSPRTLCTTASKEKSSSSNPCLQHTPQVLQPVTNPSITPKKPTPSGISSVTGPSGMAGVQFPHPSQTLQSFNIPSITPNKTTAASLSPVTSHPGKMVLPLPHPPQTLQPVNIPSITPNKTTAAGLSPVTSQLGKMVLPLPRPPQTLQPVNIPSITPNKTTAAGLLPVTSHPGKMVLPLPRPLQTLQPVNIPSITPNKTTAAGLLPVTSHPGKMVLPLPRPLQTLQPVNIPSITPNKTTAAGLLPVTSHPGKMVLPHPSQTLQPVSNLLITPNKMTASGILLVTSPPGKLQFPASQGMVIVSTNEIQKATQKIATSLTLCTSLHVTSNTNSIIATTASLVSYNTPSNLLSQTSIAVEGGKKSTKSVSVSQQTKNELYCHYCTKQFIHRRSYQFHEKTYCKKNKQSLLATTKDKTLTSSKTIETNSNSSGCYPRRRQLEEAFSTPEDSLGEMADNSQSVSPADGVVQSVSPANGVVQSVSAANGKKKNEQVKESGEKVGKQTKGKSDGTCKEVGMCKLPDKQTDFSVSFHGAAMDLSSSSLFDGHRMSPLPDFEQLLSTDIFDVPIKELVNSSNQRDSFETIYRQSEEPVSARNKTVAISSPSSVNTLQQQFNEARLDGDKNILKPTDSINLMQQSFPSCNASTLHEPNRDGKVVTNAKPSDRNMQGPDRDKNVANSVSFEINEIVQQEPDQDKLVEMKKVSTSLPEVTIDGCRMCDDMSSPASTIPYNLPEGTPYLPDDAPPFDDASQDLYSLPPDESKNILKRKGKYKKDSVAVKPGKNKKQRMEDDMASKTDVASKHKRLVNSESTLDCSKGDQRGCEDNTKATDHRLEPCQQSTPREKKKNQTKVAAEAKHISSSKSEIQFHCWETLEPSDEMTARTGNKTKVSSGNMPTKFVSSETATVMSSSSENIPKKCGSNNTPVKSVSSEKQKPVANSKTVVSDNLSDSSTRRRSDIGKVSPLYSSKPKFAWLYNDNFTMSSSTRSGNELKVFASINNDIEGSNDTMSAVNDSVISRDHSLMTSPFEQRNMAGREKQYQKTEKHKQSKNENSGKKTIGIQMKGNITKTEGERLTKVVTLISHGGEQNDTSLVTKKKPSGSYVKELHEFAPVLAGLHEKISIHGNMGCGDSPVRHLSYIESVGKDGISEEQVHEMKENKHLNVTEPDVSTRVQSDKIKTLDVDTSDVKCRHDSTVSRSTTEIPNTHVTESNSDLQSQSGCTTYPTTTTPFYPTATTSLYPTATTSLSPTTTTCEFTTSTAVSSLSSKKEMNENTSICDVGGRTKFLSLVSDHEIENCKLDFVSKADMAICNRDDVTTTSLLNSPFMTYQEDDRARQDYDMSPVNGGLQDLFDGKILEKTFHFSELDENFEKLDDFAHYENKQLSFWDISDAGESDDLKAVKTPLDVPVKRKRKDSVNLSEDYLYKRRTRKGEERMSVFTRTFFRAAYGIQMVEIKALKPIGELREIAGSLGLSLSDVDDTESS